MIFLVISVFLISAGVILFLFSLFYTGNNGNTSRQTTKKNHSDHLTVLIDDVPDIKKDKDIKTVKKLYNDKEEIAVLHEDLNNNYKESITENPGLHKDENILNNSTAESRETLLPETNKLKAVLFEDSSGTLDYSALSIPLDLDADYSAIKRIGAGEFSIDNSGFNFICDKKLFRFDFHRIRDIKAGANYLALFPSSDTAARLFIFEKEYPDIKKAEEQFSLLKKG